MLYIFDLDGTLADCSHRNHLVHGDGKPDWDAYFAACLDDKPINHMRQLYTTLSRTAHVMIWTGRNGSVSTQTLDWLRKHNFPLSRGLYDVSHPSDSWWQSLVTMRAPHCRMPDDQLKLLWLQRLRKMYTGPIMVFEDRKRVVDMWRSQPGVFCCQVAEGDF